MDTHSPETWLTILERQFYPHQDELGRDHELDFAARMIGDLVGYNHPGGNAATRARREADKKRDIAELANALKAYGTLRVAERGLGE